MVTPALRRYARIGLQAVSTTFRRFPIPLLMFLGLAAILIYRIETPYEKLKEINTILDRISGVLALGVPFSLSVSLLLERLGKEKYLLFQIGTWLAELAFLYLYYLFLFPDTDMVPVTRLLLLTLAMTLSFFFIPYLPKRDHFEIYVTSIITGAATTAFFTVVLALGLVATLFAVKSLLYSGMDSRLYADTWVLAWTIFAPLHFLSNLPCLKDSFTREHFNKVIKIMLLYIVLPIITIYTIVLYAYFSKIIVTQVWPKGIVSYLVVSYTAAGIAAIFLATPFREENKWVKVFTTGFTKLIFPLLGMMFISIGMRIGQFGFTENRYFILVIGLWATAIMIFLNFSKGKNNTVLPASLALVALLTVIGPWNAFEVSKMSQSNRFVQIASKYDLIQNGQVVKNNRVVEILDQQEISGVLRYFDQSHELSDLKYLPPNFTMDQMKDVFGFEQVYPDGRAGNYFSYNWDRTVPVKISGYETFFPLEAFTYSSGNENIYEKEIDTEKGKVKLALDPQYHLLLFKNGDRIYQYDLMNYVQPLYAKYGTNIEGGMKPGTNSSSSERAILTDETDTLKIMIIFNNINGSVIPENNQLKIENMEGEVFLTVK
ncbi:DUF4153 domain-containing protein [Candidatus Formimonas warabiya]|uniref:DUF4153 domain-containing protein n=1 Tax=Formimonas warabiya TaxID=1761012 RepID=UPI001BE44DF9|nr:DUF4153 domain-containing protein [Candidatus Formimonas warabiya]